MKHPGPAPRAPGSPPELRRSYDQVADEYVRRIADELRHKPFDRERLDRLVGYVGDLGPICDMGCGPGHVAGYLRDRGASVCGLDLSFEMLRHARRLHPGIPLVQGDMLALGVADEVWGGIAAMYSIIHVPREDVVAALRELRRTLKLGGALLLSFHLGDQIIHLDEWWGQTVSVDFVCFTSAEMEGYLEQAGLTVWGVQERDPYPEVEVQTRRAYVFARREA